MQILALSNPNYKPPKAIERFDTFDNDELGTTTGSSTTFIPEEGKPYLGRLSLKYVFSNDEANKQAQKNDENDAL